MPITFAIDKEKGYYTARFEGVVTDSELLSAYEEFHASHDALEMNDFTDLSGVELFQITTEGIRQYARQVKTRYGDPSFSTKRTAIYAPKDLAFGLARVHLAEADGLPYTPRLFRDRDEALAWLLG